MLSESFLFAVPLLCMWLLWMLMMKPSTSTIFERLTIIQIFFFGLLLRFLCASLIWGKSNYDIESYFLVSNHVLDGKDVYSMKDTKLRHPYLPLQMYWVGAARSFSDSTGLPFSFVVKSLFILADTSLIVLIYRYRQNFPNSGLNPKQGALFYALNPIALYVSAYHGQFDSLPILFSTLGLLAVPHSATRVGFWLGLGIWIKSFPVLALPTAVKLSKEFRDRLILMVCSILLPLIGVGFYIQQYDSSPKAVILRAISYNHGIGVWGYTYFLRLVGLWNENMAPLILQYFKFSRYITILGLTILWLIAIKKYEHPIRLYFITLLSFLAITHAFSIQYLLWIIPLAILCGETRGLLRYTLAAFSYAFLVYNTLILSFSITNLMPWPQADLWIIIPASLPVWLIVLCWLVDLLRFSKDYVQA